MNVVLPKGVYSVSGETAIFSIHDKKDYEIHEIVQQVYDALKEKGYNPVNQLVLMKSKRKRYRSITPQKRPAGSYIMKRHTWLIGTVLPPCGQIPVTK